MICRQIISWTVQLYLQVFSNSLWENIKREEAEYLYIKFL